MPHEAVKCISARAVVDAGSSGLKLDNEHACRNDRSCRIMTMHGSVQ